MKLYTADRHGVRTLLFSPAGCSQLYDMQETAFPCADMNELITHWTAELKDSLEQKSKALRPVPEDEVHILSPIVTPRQDVLCLGINYREHAVEAKNYSDTAFGGVREKTIYFSKRAAEISGSGAAIPSYPGLVEKLDYECELAVILGRDAKNLTPETADDSIFGYSVFNDVSVRNLQTQHKQWYFGKSLDGHTIMGPCIVTKDEIEQVYELGIRCYVNYELRQNSSIGLMIQNIEETLVELTRGMTLKAGSIIATGTPSGVGMGFVPPRFLKHGDVVRCEIDRIGAIVNTVD